MDEYEENGNDLSSIDKIRVPFDFRRFYLASNNLNINENFTSININNDEVNVDTTALICLLQSVGFQLKKFDKVASVDKLKKSNSNNELVRVTIECEASGMRADLEYRNSQCMCPKEDTNASLWNISGTGKFLTGSSTSINSLIAEEKFVESGSNLLPSLDKETVSLLGNRLASLIFLVNSHTKPTRQDGDYREDDGGKTAGETSFGLKSNPDLSFLAQQSFQDLSLSTFMTRGHTQSDMLTRNETQDRRLSLNQNLPRILNTQATEDKTGPALIRQSTFEFQDDHGEPRASPPKISSSPVNGSFSLGQFLEASDEGNGVDDCIAKAITLLEKARTMFGAQSINNQHSSIDFNNSPRDNVFLKPRNLSRRSSISSQRASPVTVRKKNQSDSKSPTVRNTVMKPQIRRSLSGSTYSSLQKPPSSTVGTGVSPVTLSRLKQNTTPKLPPRTRSIGTPSPAAKIALEVAKKRASLATSSKLAYPSVRAPSKPSSKTLSSSDKPRPMRVPNSVSAVLMDSINNKSSISFEGSKPISSGLANQSTSALTSASSASASGEKKTLNSSSASSLSTDKPRQMRIPNSISAVLMDSMNNKSAISFEGSKPICSRLANRSSSALTSISSASASGEKKTLNSSSLSSDKPRMMRMPNSISTVLMDAMREKSTAAEDGGKNNSNYSANFGLKK